MRFGPSFWKARWKGILLFILFSLIFLVTFLLYHLPVEAVLYPVALCGAIGLVVLILDYRKAAARHKELVRLLTQTSPLLEPLPEASTQLEQDYQALVELLCDRYRDLESQMDARYSDLVDYYTVWVHQIKTPISSMKLTLQNEDSETARALSEELQRIEQYVEMVLCYLRLDSDTTDYVLRELELDDIVKQAVRKFAGQFIRRKLTLDYQPLSCRVLTDEKWLLFVIEQVLSNALKYTRSGTITIALENPKVLCIKDTGIGIAPEDLPRVFEKGYTGYNGRSDKKASGLGLYLCRRICTNLGHRITAVSAIDNGTVIRIHLDREKLEAE